MTRRWRRTRPFWAGALLVLTGAEIAAMPLEVRIGAGRPGARRDRRARHRDGARRGGALPVTPARTPGTTAN
ncbi:DUF6114 domain-containing protein [Streptomyces sp. NPDC026206]|uniref:DUF6114 domain-containing protein n=1 Tax=Streptomyces sp. NPDC026206 TaxID=3157089 RepID=UPI0033C90E4F